MKLWKTVLGLLRKSYSNISPCPVQHFSPLILASKPTPPPPPPHTHTHTLAKKWVSNSQSFSLSLSWTYCLNRWRISSLAWPSQQKQVIVIVTCCIFENKDLFWTVVKGMAIFLKFWPHQWLNFLFSSCTAIRQWSVLSRLSCRTTNTKSKTFTNV